MKILVKALATLTILLSVGVRSEKARVRGEKEIPEPFRRIHSAPLKYKPLRHLKPRQLHYESQLIGRENIRAQRQALLRALPAKPPRHKPDLTPISELRLHQLMEARQLSPVKAKRSAYARQTTASGGTGSGIHPLHLDPIEYPVSEVVDFTSGDYVDNLDVVWAEFTAPLDSDYIYVNFNFIDFENGFDYVYVEDINGNVCDSFTGSHGVVDSTACPGNYARVVVVTDGTLNGADGYSGFEISGYTYAVTPPNTPPVAIATATSYDISQGETDSFSGAQSYDPDRGDYLTYYHWDFGDGTTSDLENPDHIYDVPGNYLVSLEVGDSNGGYDTDSFTIVVHEPSAPVNVTYAASTDAVSVSWSPGGTDDSGDYVLVWGLQGTTVDCDHGLGSVSVHATSTTVTGLGAGTPWEFALCSFNDAGYPSQPVTFDVTTELNAVPLQLPPGEPTIGMVRPNTFDISFTAPEGSRQYVLWFKPTLTSPTWTQMDAWTSFYAGEPHTFEETVASPFGFFVVRPVN